MRAVSYMAALSLRSNVRTARGWFGPARVLCASPTVNFLWCEMSDHADTVEAIERHNVQIARRIVEYWRHQGVEIRLTGDPTKEPRSVLGPNGLPRAYEGEDAIRVTSL
jgi:hypothetical protein